MNKILLTLLLVGFVCGCKPKSETIKPAGEITCKQLSYVWVSNSFGDNNLVKANDVYTYDKAGKLIELRSLDNTTRYDYDAKGNRIKSTKYALSQGKDIKSSETDYVYNTANQLIREVTNNVNQSGVFQKELELVFEYYANGKMKKRTAFYRGATAPSALTEYNEKGNITYHEYLDGSYLKMEYNSADLVVKQTQFDNSNKQTSVYQYEYNSQNIEVKSSYFFNGVLINYHTFEYNEKGQVINRTIYNKDGTIDTKFITEYTGESFKVSTYNSKNELTSYENNEVQNGLLLKESTYRESKLQYYTSYTYDSHKNVIKREVFDGNSAMTGREEWSYRCD